MQPCLTEIAIWAGLKTDRDVVTSTLPTDSGRPIMLPKSPDFPKYLALSACWGVKTDMLANVNETGMARRYG